MENMVKVDKKTHISEILETAQNIAVLPSKISGLDAFAAGAAFYQMLKEKDKRAFFVYHGSIPEGGNGLIRESDITSDIFQKELEISVDYSDTPASKVHYSTHDQTLLLNLGPINKDFDTSRRVSSKIKGLEFDLIITLGAQDKEDFGQVYKELEVNFAQAVVINIDNTERNTRFGTINVIDPLADSVSLMILQKSAKWGLKIDKRAAKALLTGIMNIPAIPS